MVRIKHLSYIKTGLFASTLLLTGCPFDSDDAPNVNTSSQRPSLEIGYHMGNVSWVSGFRYDVNNIYIGRVSYTSGADMTWLTDDDDVRSYDDYSYDTNDNQTRRAYYNSAGADMTWFTGDDGVSSYNGYTYDVNGNQTRQAYYNSAGIDGTWFTSDDVVSSYSGYTYDTNGDQTRQAYYYSWSGGAGLDGIWFTTDDVPYSYTDYTHDTSGNRIGLTSYNAAGIDGIWFTDDDEISNEWIMEEGEIANPEILFQDRMH